MHVGPASLISPNDSPGLVFLSKLLQALDELTPTMESLQTLMTPESRFVVNNGPPATLKDVLPIFARRAEAVAEFGHELSRAWDIDVHGDGSERHILSESLSQTVLRGDIEGVRIPVAEFNVVELRRGEGGEGGEQGYRVVEIRTWMNGGAVAARRAIIGGGGDIPSV